MRSQDERHDEGEGVLRGLAHPQHRRCSFGSILAACLLILLVVTASVVQLFTIPQSEALTSATTSDRRPVFSRPHGRLHVSLYTRHCLTPIHMLRNMERMLFDVTEALTSVGAVFWLDQGTLLGALRFASFLPYDDDIDLGMMEDEFDRVRDSLEARLLHNKSYAMFHFKPQNDRNLLVQIFFEDPRRPIRGEDDLHLDIFLYRHVRAVEAHKGVNNSTTNAQITRSDHSTESDLPFIRPVSNSWHATYADHFPQYAKNGGIPEKTLFGIEARSTRQLILAKPLQPARQRYSFLSSPRDGIPPAGSIVGPFGHNSLMIIQPSPDEPAANIGALPARERHLRKIIFNNRWMPIPVDPWTFLSLTVSRDATLVFLRMEQHHGGPCEKYHAVASDVVLRHNASLHAMLSHLEQAFNLHQSRSRYDRCSGNLCQLSIFGHERMRVKQQVGQSAIWSSIVEEFASVSSQPLINTSIMNS